jgi:hypothetical protein
LRYAFLRRDILGRRDEKINVTSNTIASIV